MKSTILNSAAALTLIAGTATAGGVQRDGDRSQILFEEGENYLEFSATSVAPNVSGTRASVASGDMQRTYQNFHLGYKREVSETLSFALLAQENVGANVAYDVGTGYLFARSTAELNSLAVTGLVKHQFNDRFSAYGGLRIQGMSGDVTITFPVPYTLSVGSDYQVGYVLGGAYEIPDIALRVAFTYESQTEHDYSDSAGNPFKVKIPQAATLHFQSGVAQSTIAFGSVRWQEWSEFEIRPGDFLGGTTPIASEPSDIWTYEIGVGQRFNENWSGAFTIGYEKNRGDIVGNLSARDGFLSYGAGMKYSTEAYEISAGLKYIDVGSAITSAGANFSGNDAIAFGVKMGFRF